MEEIKNFVSYVISAGNLAPDDWNTLETMIEDYVASQPQSTSTEEE